eukprot:m.186883 g.186883  ORF g.186883 m.186883 type:complete len:73 (+) comp17512_c0_seq1:2210-2428(+)
MDHMRLLHQRDPQGFDRAALSELFGVSYNAVSRILKSKFTPKPQELERQERNKAKAAAAGGGGGGGGLNRRP